MNSATVVTIVIIVMVLAIIASLGRGLFNLLVSDQASNKVVMSLSYRIGLSAILFASLIVAIYMGWIIPNPPLL
jgi:hypothetical protein